MLKLELWTSSWSTGSFYHIRGLITLNSICFMRIQSFSENACRTTGSITSSKTQCRINFKPHCWTGNESIISCPPLLRQRSRAFLGTVASRQSPFFRRFYFRFRHGLCLATVKQEKSTKIQVFNADLCLHGLQSRMFAALPSAVLEKHCNISREALVSQLHVLQF